MLLRLTCSLPAIMLTLPAPPRARAAGVIKRFNASRLKETHGTGLYTAMRVLWALALIRPDHEGQDDAGSHGR